MEFVGTTVESLTVSFLNLAFDIDHSTLLDWLSIGVIKFELLLLCIS